MDDVIDEVQREWEAKLKESPDARVVHGKQGAQLMTGASIRGDARVILRDRRLWHRGSDLMDVFNLRRARRLTKAAAAGTTARWTSASCSATTAAPTASRTRAAQSCTTLITGARSWIQSLRSTSRARRTWWTDTSVSAESTKCQAMHTNIYVSSHKPPARMPCCESVSSK